MSETLKNKIFAVRIPTERYDPILQRNENDIKDVAYADDVRAAVQFLKDQLAKIEVYDLDWKVDTLPEHCRDQDMYSMKTLFKIIDESFRDVV